MIPYLQINHLGVSRDELGGKTSTTSAPGRSVHRRSPGELNGNVQLHVALEKGATFVFGSWICITDSACNFCHHHVNTEKPEASAPTSHCDINELASDLDEIPTSDLIGNNEDKFGSITQLVRTQHSHHLSTSATVQVPIRIGK